MIHVPGDGSRWSCTAEGTTRAFISGHVDASQHLNSPMHLTTHEPSLLTASTHPTHMHNTSFCKNTWNTGVGIAHIHYSSQLHPRPTFPFIPHLSYGHFGAQTRSRQPRQSSSLLQHVAGVSPVNDAAGLMQSDSSCHACIWHQK